MAYDYKALGLKCGLECHQQLDVGKLFCRCPSLMREDKPDIIFKRKIRPVPSELGEYDPAAMEAFKKGLSYVYQAYSDSTCLVETDSEPPLPLNEKALETILEVALLIKAKILDHVFVMRKGIFDGSNVSGFQRTALVAVGGKIPLKKKEVGVQGLILEEDAARLIEKREKEKEIVYRLDRLGIPLIELATEPELFTPEEAKECALKIGELFRITGKAKRGLGTIRQDLNVSIKEGERIEIKGIQELELIDEYIKREIRRQLTLIEIKKELMKKKVKEEELKPDFISLANELKSSQSKIIQSQLKQGKTVFGLKLSGFRGLLGKEVQPGKRFGTELADYVKARTLLKGIIHSDELPGYGLSDEDIAKIMIDLKVKEHDAFVLVLGKEIDAVQALEIVLERCRQALKGVPKETRGAIGNGNTEYQRVLGGAARMYPETDIPSIKIEEAKLKALKKRLPLWAEERKKLYLKKGLSEKLAEKMKLSNYARFYEELLEKGFDVTVSAVVLLEHLIKLRRDGVPVENLSQEMIEEILAALKKDLISKDAVLDILKARALNPKKSLSELIEKLKLTKVEAGELKAIIRKIVSSHEKLVKERKMHALSALMGEAMRELKGKASGQEVAKLLKEELKKYL